MESNSEELTRQRFDAFARAVRGYAGRINTASLTGDTRTVQRLSVYMVEEACLHIRRLNGVPDNVDDSGEDGADDYNLTDLNAQFGTEPEA